MKQITQKIKYLWDQFNSVEGRPRGSGAASPERLIAFGVLLLFVLLWVAVQYINGRSTLRGAHELLGDPSLADTTTFVVAMMMLLEPCTFHRLPNEKRRFSLIASLLLIGLLCHGFSGLTSALYFTDRLGDGVDAQEQAHVVDNINSVIDFVNNTDREIDENLAKIDAASERVAEEKSKGLYSGKGKGRGDKWEELKAAFEEAEREYGHLRFIKRESAEVVKKIISFNVHQDDAQNEFLKLYAELQPYYRAKIPAIKQVKPPSQIERAIRAISPVASHGGADKSVQTVSLSVSALLEFCTLILGVMVAINYRRWQEVKVKHNCDHYGEVAYVEAGEYIASFGSCLNRADNEKLRSRLSTKILLTVVKMVDQTKHCADGYYPLRVVLPDGSQGISVRSSFDEVCMSFWGRVLPILKENGQVRVIDEVCHVQLAPFISWVNKLSCKRPFVGNIMVELDAFFESVNERTVPFKVLDDFKSRMKDDIRRSHLIALGSGDKHHPQQ